MVKGVSARFVTYEETVPKLLKIIKFDDELKKHEKIVFKVDLSEDPVGGSQKEFVEAVIRYAVMHKAPGAEVALAEGADGEDTMELFERLGYSELAEKYGIGLIDLNQSEVEEVTSPRFLRFDSIKFPTTLKDCFLITLPLLRPDDELQMTGSLASMRAAFPARHYKGFFTKRKSKIASIPAKYQIHDIIQCRAPDFTLTDASQHGYILAGHAMPMDQQSAKLLGMDWRDITYLHLMDDSEHTSEQENENPINEK